MACDIAAGRIEPCKDSIGGLDAIYFVNDGDLTGYTMDSSNTDVIEAVLGTPSAYKFDLKGNSTYQEDITTSRENGTTYFQQVLTVTLKKLDVATHKAVKLLSYGNPKVIIKDNNGNFFLAGKDFGMDVTGGTVVTGGAMGDLSGYTLVLTGMEKTPANFFEATNETGLTTAGFTIVAGS
jgi:hypothetical protein